MRITVSGDAARIAFTMSATAVLPCTVAVGLFGIAEEHQAGALRRLDHLGEVDVQLAVEADLAHGEPIFLAVSRGFSNDGQAVTSGLVGEVKARTACVRISPEPGPSTMCSFLALNFCARAPIRAPSFWVALKG